MTPDHSSTSLVVAFGDSTRRHGPIAVRQVLPNPMPIGAILRRYASAVGCELQVKLVRQKAT